MSISSVIIIAPIVLFSIIAVAVILERSIFLSRNKVPLDYYKNPHIEEFADFRQLVAKRRNKTLFDRFLSELMQKTFKSKEALREYIDTELAGIVILYNKRVYLIGVFARLSTLLGLLGTVVGMISAFNNIVSKGISNAGIVASGISTALMTTAVGLIVAIPLTFFYEHFIARIDDEMKKMEIIISHMLSLLYGGTAK